MIVAVVAAFVLSQAPAPAPAPAATVSVTSAWIRLPPPASMTAAGFFTLSNTGSADRKLLSASDDVAKTTELHTHLMEGGVMKMRAVAAVDVKAGASVAFGPGGLHVMFIDLVKPLADKQVVKLHLRFDDGSVVDVDAVVSREAPTTAPKK